MTLQSQDLPEGVFARERQDEIARLVDERGRARVNELSARFGVSAVTIRKDLLALEGDRRVVRTHGGAIAVRGGGPELAFDIRERLQRDEKSRIGAAAADRVSDGESIVLDASTSALFVARQLKSVDVWHGLTVVTNSIRIASELAGHRGITVLLLGGRVRWEALSVVGPLGDGVFRRVNVQKAFLGAAGFTIEAGLSDAMEEEAQIKRSMVAAARDVYALVDHTKWGRIASATFCRTDRLTGVFTDSVAPAAMVADLRALGTEVVEVDGQVRESDAAPRGRAVTTEAATVTAQPADAAGTPRVELRGISKRFAATAALTDVSMDLRSGEIQALVGENGAGKSTLVKILAGVHQPDAGTILLDGVPTQIHGPAHSRSLGIAVVHQEPRLFPDLTVAENVFIGHAPSGAVRSIDWRGMRKAAQALFAELDVQLDVGAQVRGLFDGRPAADRDRQGSLGRRRCAHPGRADGLPLGPRGRPAVRDRSTPARPRGRHRLRQPPARRGLRAVRPRDGVP